LNALATFQIFMWRSMLKPQRLPHTDPKPLFHCRLEIKSNLSTGDARELSCSRSDTLRYDETRRRDAEAWKSWNDLARFQGSLQQHLAKGDKSRPQFIKSIRNIVDVSLVVMRGVGNRGYGCCEREKEGEGFGTSHFPGFIRLESGSPAQQDPPLRLPHWESNHNKPP
jgi:hypothetical protein